jgi:hypothetical protein
MGLLLRLLPPLTWNATGSRRNVAALDANKSSTFTSTGFSSVRKGPRRFKIL